MREKLGIATFAVVLVVVWGLGFLWFRGDLQLSGSDGPITGLAVEGSSGPSPSPTSGPSVGASSGPSSGSSSSASASADLPGSPSVSSPASEVPAYTGTVTRAEELRPVDLNPTAVRPRPQVLPPVADFTMATFNLLGSSHTAAGGESASRASGPRRLSGALQVLAQHQVTVVGFQEFQPDQRAAFQRQAKGWALYPGLSMGRRAGENSVAWRTDTWEMVRPGLVPIPYFNGNIRPMPYVLLRHKETGVQAYFSTFHNPADTGRFRNQQRFRTAATGREIALFNQLEATGVPQLVTGDMNERDEYFCRVTGSTPLAAAAGGSHTGGCQPPRPTQIDWILGSPGLRFGNYQIDRSPLVRRTTDHPVVITDVTLDALRFTHAYDPSPATSP